VSGERDGLRPLSESRSASRAGRPRLPLKDELTLALLPTATVLTVLALTETFSQQRILFASLASSAFLIYLDPLHPTNGVGTLFVSHLMAAGLGFLMLVLLGPGYVSAGAAMVLTIALMILLDAVHPPATSTALAFAFRTGVDNNVVIFTVAVAMTAILVMLQRMAVRRLARYGRRPSKPG
jgi:CBS-domain-containing membrane protein